MAGYSPTRRVADAMDRVNPVYIPRNHHVEEALDAATEGDLDPFRQLVEVLARPSTSAPGSSATRRRRRAGPPVPHLLRHLTVRADRFHRVFG